MKIEAPKISVVKNVLLQTLLLVVIFIVINLLVHGFDTFRLGVNIIIMAVSTCVMALVFSIPRFRKSILSIELTESDVIIAKVNNTRNTLSWKDINAISIKRIVTGNKYIRLPGYLFSNSKQNEEYLNFIDRKIYGEATSCLECGDIIPEGENVCRSCGWGYRK